MPNFNSSYLGHVIKVVLAHAEFELEGRSLIWLDALVAKYGTDFKGAFHIFIVLLVLKDCSGNNAERFVHLIVLNVHRIEQGNISD